MTLLDECWEVRGLRTAQGYGLYGKGNKGKTRLTHRLVWAWVNWNGEGDWRAIPEGMCVLHRCDNPPCVNPKHLFLGTLGDNNRDTTQKGRHWNSKKTHCKRGHDLSIHARVMPRPNGLVARQCVPCQRMNHRKWIDEHPSGKLCR